MFAVMSHVPANLFILLDNRNSRHCELQYLQSPLLCSLDEPRGAIFSGDRCWGCGWCSGCMLAGMHLFPLSCMLQRGACSSVWRGWGVGLACGHAAVQESLSSSPPPIHSCTPGCVLPDWRVTAGLSGSLRCSATGLLPLLDWLNPHETWYPHRWGAYAMWLWGIPCQSNTSSLSGLVCSATQQQHTYTAPL